MTDAPTLAKRLEPFHAVLFGLDRGCKHTDEAKAAWGPALGREIAYVACDASEQAEDLCARAGIRMTPTLSFGGVQFPGFVPLTKARELLDLADTVGEALESRRSTLFTRPNCGWCDRQRLLLGPLVKHVEFVDCSREKKRCADAGVGPVPAWRMGDDSSGAPLIPGFRVLPELQAMVQADAEGLTRMSAQANVDGSTC